VCRASQLEAFFQWNSDTYEAKLLKWYRDAEFKDLPKFKEKWGTLTDLTDRLSKRVTALKQTVESLNAAVDSRVQLLNELSGIKLNDSKEMKALFERITYEGTQALGENDNWLRVRVNKEALRNSARAVIDQCKGIMAERREERKYEKLIGSVSQPGDLKEEIRSTFQLLRECMAVNAEAILVAKSRGHRHFPVILHAYVMYSLSGSCTNAVLLQRINSLAISFFC